MTNVTPITNRAREPKRDHHPSKTEARFVTPEEMATWLQPPFQRPIKENDKVLHFMEALQFDPCIGGVITLGQLPGDPGFYKVDGGHRIFGALNCGQPEFYAEIRVVQYPNLAAMSEDFVKLNSPLVQMRPDDKLRGLEFTTPLLKQLHDQCPFIAYDNVRRSKTNSGVLSMSSCLRCWNGSDADTPSVAGGISAMEVATELDQNQMTWLSAFLQTAHAAWKNDPENYSLWVGLNLTMCMWMYRQLVLKSDKKSKTVRMNTAEFGKCLMAVSANADYIEWLKGRNMGERNRKPCYDRLKTIFTKRLADMRSGRVMFPQPAWASGKV